MLRTEIPEFPKKDLLIKFKNKQNNKVKMSNISMFNKMPLSRLNIIIKKIATDIATPLRPSIKFKKL